MTGAFHKAEDFAPGDTRMQRFPRFAPGAFEKNMALVRRLEALAAKRGATAAQLALAWVLAKGERFAPIPGTKRRKYLEQNAAAASIKLSAAEVAELEKAVSETEIAGERYAAPAMKAIDR